jgi:hypothetical protein
LHWYSSSPPTTASYISTIKNQFGLTSEEDAFLQQLMKDSNGWNQQQLPQLPQLPQQQQKVAARQSPMRVANKKRKAEVQLEEFEAEEEDDHDDTDDDDDEEEEEEETEVLSSSSEESLFSKRANSSSSRFSSTTILNKPNSSNRRHLSNNNKKKDLSTKKPPNSISPSDIQENVQQPQDLTSSDSKSKNWLPEKTYIQMLHQATNGQVEFLEDNFPLEAGSIFFTKRPFKKAWKLTTDWKNCGRKKEKLEGGSCLRIFYRRHKDNPDLRKRMILMRDNAEIVLHHITLFNRRTPFRRSSKEKS